MGELNWTLPADMQGIFLLRLTATVDGVQYQNAYYFTTHAQYPYSDAIHQTGVILEGAAVQKSSDSYMLEIRNTGTAAALHICISDQTDAFLLDLEDNFFTLLPGESRQIHVGFRKKFRFGFDENKNLTASAPVFQAVCLSGESVSLN